MARPADDGPTDVYVDVDVNSLAEAGVELAKLATELERATDTVRAEALEVLDAIPPSDLFNAYAFCWGRWSAQCDGAAAGVASAGRHAQSCAAGYRALDRCMTPR